jgi:hypothetical protein
VNDLPARHNDKGSCGEPAVSSCPNCLLFHIPVLQGRDITCSFPTNYDTDSFGNRWKNPGFCVIHKQLAWLRATVSLRLSMMHNAVNSQTWLFYSLNLALVHCTLKVGHPLIKVQFFMKKCSATFRREVLTQYHSALSRQTVWYQSWRVPELASEMSPATPISAYTPDFKYIVITHMRAHYLSITDFSIASLATVSR